MAAEDALDAAELAAELAAVELAALADALEADALDDAALLEAEPPQAVSTTAMAIAIATTMPHLGYVYLSYALPANLLVISLCLFVEQVGYGLGFSFYLQLLSQVSSHSVSDSHRTLCKSLMALSLMVPTMAAGALQTALGYRHFFLLVLLSCGTTFLTAFMAKKRSLGVHKK